MGPKAAAGGVGLMLLGVGLPSLLNVSWSVGAIFSLIGIVLLLYSCISWRFGKNSKSVPSNALQVWVRVIAGLVLLCYVAYVVYRFFVPTITFSYENTSRYIVRAPDPDRDVIFIEIAVSQRLKCARAFLKSIHPITDNDRAVPFGTNPLRSDQRMQISWYDAGPPAFECRPVANQDRIAPFHILDKGTRLALITNTSAAQLTPVFNDIPPGEYRIEIEIDDEMLPHGAVKYFEVRWDGKRGGFSMK